jgi:hypothetical protein
LLGRQKCEDFVNAGSNPSLSANFFFGFRFASLLFIVGPNKKPRRKVHCALSGFLVFVLVLCAASRSQANSAEFF